MDHANSVQPRLPSPPRLSSLSSAERQDRIAEFVALNGRASVEDLATALQISIATARRDIVVLSQHGRVQRVHGGVRSRHIEATAQPELPALQREEEQREEKQRIGAMAAARVRPGETIFIGSGTTALAAARSLRTRQDLRTHTADPTTVITNSLLVINALADASHIELIVLGGQLRRSEMSLIGHTAERALADLRADRVLMGIRAVDARAGLTNAWLPETQTDRAILAIAREVVLLADHTKFGHIAPAFVAPLNAAHVIITDNQTSNEHIEAAVAAGVRVIQA